MATSRTLRETFDGRPEHVIVALEHTLHELSMDIQTYDPYAGVVMFKTPMTMWSWGENLHARVFPSGADQTDVEIRSSLKFGLVDWGKNRRNIEKVTTALRARLASGDYSWPVQQPSLTQAPPSEGWHPDPTGRHQLRWWNGQQWSEHVNDHGTPGTDPLPAPGVG